MTQEELAAVIAAVQALAQAPQEPGAPQMSAWKREARREAVHGQAQDDVR